MILNLDLRFETIFRTVEKDTQHRGAIFPEDCLGA